jgi:hypothetical protein
MRRRQKAEAEISSAFCKDFVVLISPMRYSLSSNSSVIAIRNGSSGPNETFNFATNCLISPQSLLYEVLGTKTVEEEQVEPGTLEEVSIHGIIYNVHEK